ncbi:hypothetical protein [Kitasatospora cheerisanensis]|uniref:Uncharacterized protein n=1 Tax=Kitasatospora cheerisanensis KCTC 2395 TaxID=1348663 RepID=A0A066YV82_9ACTN|nr:hypothetical protein [Kitasatospora cheerisanensis]KDN81830.1 hypothetical protein KCH_65500 [Kitasatospora cheerisanensis KCTC 2395]
MASDKKRPSRRSVIVTAVVAAVLAGGGVTAWQLAGSGEESRPLSTDEASRLALSRLNLYQASPVRVTLKAQEGDGMVVEVQGVVDYRSKHAAGSYTVTGKDGAVDQGLVVWDAGGLGLAKQAAGATGPAWEQAEHVPRSGWTSRSYGTDPLDAGLNMLIQLGADRPDNPLLLVQSGPRWLGRDRIDGRDYDRIAGPRSRDAADKETGTSPITYWIDADGGLRRVTMRMAGLGTPATLELGGRDAGAKLPEAPWATAG